jgi:hypothetical protein
MNCENKITRVILDSLSQTTESCVVIQFYFDHRMQLYGVQA